MPLVNFLRLFSVFSLAVLNISFTALPVNALAVDRGHIGRSPNPAHAGLAKRNGSSGRCRPRSGAPSPTSSSSPSLAPTSLPPSTPTPSPQPPYHVTPTTTTTTTTTSPAYTPSTPNSLSKFGISWSNTEEDSIHNVITPDSPLRLVMNWDYRGYGNIVTLPENALYMATIANAGVDWNDVTTTLKNAHNYHRHIRTFNEPDQPGQANMSPAEACQLIKQHLLILKAQFGYELLSPAVTTSPGGLNWLKTFLGYGDCGTTIVDVHFYGISSKDFIASVESFSAFGQPLYYTEIGAMDYYHNVQASPQQYEDVFNGSMEECKTNPMIKICMLFGFFYPTIPGNLGVENRLLECPNNQPGKNCGPNARGYQYLNL